MSKQDRYWVVGPSEQPSFIELETNLGTLVIPSEAQLRDRAYMKARFAEIGFDMPEMGPAEWQDFCNMVLETAAENSPPPRLSA